MKIIECDQRSLEWWHARRGIATASSFSRIMTAKKHELSAQADDLIAELIAEEMCPTADENYMSGSMMHGIICEPEARSWYELTHNCETKQVGFILTDDGRFGCSPDSLVDDDGLLEIKCPQPKTHVKYLLAQTVPDEYLMQIHGQLVVTGRSWCDFLSYCSGLPNLLVRVRPNETTQRLRVVLELFWDKLTKAREAVKRYG